ncbi:MAG: sulfatase-like hydrolase/transferase [Pontibacterium sp.]
MDNNKEQQQNSSTPLAGPNILMFMVDQMQFPRFCYGEEHGFADPIKHILGFQGSAEEENEYKEHFPGFWKLRENTYVFRNHRIASSACVPSRTALFTGQYGTRTGVLQTDGVFKEGAKKRFAWLEKNTFATTGNWLREHGYKTHYFGKWHITGEETTHLEDYGFSDWEQSYPDPHGTLPNNLGHFRDYQFEDVVCTFLRKQGLGVPYSVAHAEANASLNPTDGPSPTDAPTPWFAVASFTNPHDIASYPGLPSSVYNENVEGASYTLAVPPQNAQSETSFAGTMKLTLNQSGIEQSCATEAPNWDEKLHQAGKPACQHEYRYKMGLTLTAKGGRYYAEQQLAKGAYAHCTSDDETEAAMLQDAVDFIMDANSTGLPFALTDDPQLASRAFIQYYAYLLSEVDKHLYKVLTTLEESGQAENTIVMFCPDHGEYAGAHGALMEKWHTGYDEVIHVPYIVRFPKALRPKLNELKQIDALTSHIDILPTILELAGIDAARQSEILNSLQKNGYPETLAPIGTSLVPLMDGTSSVIEGRDGVLFITHDTITEGFEHERSGDKVKRRRPSIESVEVFEAAVKELIDGAGKKYPSDAALISEGAVIQPNNVHAVVDKQGWKLVKYLDSTNPNIPHQYELYQLADVANNNEPIDPKEEYNLVNYQDGSPRDLSGLPIVPTADVATRFDELMSLMHTLEAQWLDEVAQA